MTATNNIKDEKIKMTIEKANAKPIVKRGRPRKYHTEEERRAAINQQIREYRQRKKDKFKKTVKQLEELQNKNKDLVLSIHRLTLLYILIYTFYLRNIHPIHNH